VLCGLCGESSLFGFVVCGCLGLVCGFVLCVCRGWRGFGLRWSFLGVVLWGVLVLGFCFVFGVGLGRGVGCLGLLGGVGFVGGVLFVLCVFCWLFVCL